MERRPDNRKFYYLLAVVFLFTMAYQIGFSISAIEYRRNYAIEAAQPLAISLDSDRLSWTQRPLADLGVRPGDELLEIDGQRYGGIAELARMVASKHPGDVLRITLLRTGHSQPETFEAPLQAVGPSGLGALGWLIVASLTVLTPTFCLLLGFGVTAIRPRDPLAWLLLVLMLSFAQMSTANDLSLNVLMTWPAIARQAGIFYHTLFAGTWSIWILLFGVYFPERLSLDQRLPWLKWLLIGPVGVAAILDAVAIVGHAENFRLVSFLPQFTGPLARATLFIAMAAISSYFANLSAKIGTASSNDARRRLILLIFGTSAALTPLFLVVLYGLFRGGMDDISENVFIPCILMLALFPITLAYVIVVQRALDVRVVIRQGLRYALARRGILVLQFVLVGIVMLAAVTLLADPARNRPRKIQVIALGIIAAIGIRRGGDKLAQWTDRRFFREAYDAEQILSELGNEVRTMIETGPLLETVARKISDSLHVERVAMLVKEDGHYEPSFALGYDTPALFRFEESDGTVGTLKREKKPLRVYFDDPGSWIYREPALTDSDRQRLQRLDAQLLLPLAFKEKLIGFMSLGSKRSEEPYSNNDVRLLESLAMQTSLALENSNLTEAIAKEVAHREILNRELEIAREVQERLFPQSYPAVAGLEYAGRCRPALGVGGDYYDFIELPDGWLGIGIGDVSGKGIPAALLMASLQASLRGQTISGAPDLALLMSNINRLIFATSPSNRYATFFYGQYDPATRRFVYVNGGHNPPMVFRGDEVLRLEDGGPVVGLFKPARYTQGSVQLAAGDVVVLYTDGISEAMNAEDEEWDEDRMIASVRACRNQSALEMIERIMQDADAFVAGAPQHDDMTIMIVKLVS
jgi:sigma-B regulation protein RsbU (phosphoserine phosphatase)